MALAGLREHLQREHDVPRVERLTDAEVLREHRHDHDHQED